MIDWKKVFNKRSLLGIVMIVLGQVITFVCEKVAGDGSNGVLVSICIILSVLSVFCSIAGLIILFTDAADTFRTTHISRIMWGLLALAFVFGVVIGIYHVFN